MEIRRITTVDEKTYSDLIDLLEYLGDKEADIVAGADYIKSTLDIEFFLGCFDGNDLVAVIYLQSPNALYPKRANLYFTIAYPHVPKKITKEMFDLACKWAIEHGAAYMWGWSKRSPKVLNRRYGFKIVKERQVVLPLVGDDYLKIEFDEGYNNDKGN